MKLSYVVFEGIDGAGKTTQVELLANYLRSIDIVPILLEEPSRGPFGMEVRRLAEIDELGSLEHQRRIFDADRKDHVERRIRPLLRFVKENSGFVVLQSRYLLSSPAYQAGSFDCDEMRSMLEAQAAWAPEPDVVVVLDLPVSQAMTRMSGRRKDAFERAENLEKVRRRFQILCTMAQNRAILVDADGAAEDVAIRVRQALAERQGAGDGER